MKESEIIQTFFKGQILPDDDCHFIPPHQLVTTDSLVEGTHFLHEWSSPAQLADKLVEVNVSDIAASGGIPEICFLNLGLSDLSKQDKWIHAFSRAFQKKMKTYKMKLVGGDTFYSNTTHLTLTVIGNCEKPWNRSGGKNGDTLYVTGEIGDSELGFQSLKQNWQARKFHAAKKKHISPTSQVGLVQKLSQFGIHACMDLTDGLIQDSERLAQASKGIIEINLNDLPFSKLAYETLGWDGVLGSGEELQLLFLTDQVIPKKIGNVHISKIGKFSKTKDRRTEKQVTFLLDGVIYHPRKIGYSHFD